MRWGEYVDEWGCRFTNIHEGVIGEVKEPVICEEDWSDAGKVHIPVELLTFDADAVNRFCRETDRFVIAGCCPRPFEQLQFLRSTQELYMDLMDPPRGNAGFYGKDAWLLLRPSGEMGADGGGCTEFYG